MTGAENHLDEDLPDDMIVRNAATEMLTVARRAHRVEVCLVTIAAALMVIVAGFTGFNTYRLWVVNKNLTALVETIEANQVALQRYNEEHSRTAGLSHDALAVNLSCMSSFFYDLATNGPQPAKAVLDACFQPTTPSPPAMPLPGETRDGKR